MDFAKLYNLIADHEQQNGTPLLIGPAWINTDGLGAIDIEANGKGAELIETADELRDFCGAALYAEILDYMEGKTAPDRYTDDAFFFTDQTKRRDEA